MGNQAWAFIQPWIAVVGASAIVLILAAIAVGAVCAVIRFIRYD